jgi:hypothetical protein
VGSELSRKEEEVTLEAATTTAKWAMAIIKGTLDKT